MAPEPADHGEFILETSWNDDLKLLRQGIEYARTNAAKPGHHWHRIVAKQTLEDTSVEIIKMYHVDLNLGMAVITETRNGEETAKRTVRVSDLG